MGGLNLYEAPSSLVEGESGDRFCREQSGEQSPSALPALPVSRLLPQPHLFSSLRIHLTPRGLLQSGPLAFKCGHIHLQRKPYIRIANGDLSHLL